MDNRYPFLWGKILSIKRITLKENYEIINDYNDTANVINFFFFNIVINHNVPEYRDCESISGNNSDSILKAIVKCINHPSITAIKNCYLLILWTEKKILRKLIVWITQKYV